MQHIGQLLRIFPAIPRPSMINGGSSVIKDSTTHGMITDADSAARPEISHSLSGCKLLRSDWSTNRYFRGSYSYPGPAASGQSADDLVAPLTAPAAAAAGSSDVGSDHALVCFAGEATSRHYMGTVHGAYMSGVREAERLLRQWGLKQ